VGALADLRAAVAASLGDVAEVASGAWTVHPSVVDAITPPAYMLVWADPWLLAGSACTYDARLTVVCVSARLEPDPGVETLELMVTAVLEAVPLPAVEVLPPAPFDIGGVHYQAARVTVRQFVTVERMVP